MVSTPKDNCSNYIARNTAGQFQCGPNKVYLVIGKRYKYSFFFFFLFRFNRNIKTRYSDYNIGHGSDDWLYLVEWLAKRGALKVVVPLENSSLTPKMSRKFNILTDRYKSLNVQLVSRSLLNTENSAYNLLNNSSTTRCPLGAVFFLSSVSSTVVDACFVS